MTAKLISALVLVLLYTGFAYRRRRRVHIPLMAAAFVIDLGLVLALEISRGVVEEVVSEPLAGIMIIHVPLAVATVLLYFPQVAFGRALARGSQRARAWHRRLGYTLLVCRTGVFITSLFI